MPSTLPRHKRTAHNYKRWLGTVNNPTMKRKVQILNAFADEEYNKDKAKLLADKCKPKVIKEKAIKKKY